MNATMSTRLVDGDYHHQPIPQRARHYWAEKIELGSRAFVHDAQPHPYSNWGFRDHLDWSLACLRETRTT